MFEFVVGLDYGKEHSYTVASILARSKQWAEFESYKRDFLPDGKPRGEPNAARYHGEDERWQERVPPRILICRWIRVLPLGGSSDWQADRIAELLSQPPLSTSYKRNYELVVDASGAGSDLCDSLRRHHCIHAIRAVIMGGRKETYDKNTGEYGLPRTPLILGLQAALEKPHRLLEIAHNVSNREQLIKEAQNLKPETTAAGYERVGHITDGITDDRVFSLALGLWWAKKRFFGQVHRSASQTMRNLVYQPPKKMPFNRDDFEGW